MAELFAGEKLPKEEGKVSAAVFEDGIAVAANEVRQKKKRYRGLLMIMAALLVVVAGLGIGKSLKEKFADPLADKMLVMSAFIMLVGINQAPAWVVSVIICRELAVTGLRLLLVENGGTVLAAAMPGKIKTVTQMLSIILLLCHLHFVGTIMLYIALFFTIYSGYDYFKGAGFLFKDTFK